MGRKRCNAEYALYKGEELLAIGTLDELAEQQGVSRNSIYHYSLPIYQRKGNVKKVRNRKIVVRLD